MLNRKGRSARRRPLDWLFPPFYDTGKHGGSAGHSMNDAQGRVPARLPGGRKSIFCCLTAWWGMVIALALLGEAVGDSSSDLPIAELRLNTTAANLSVPLLLNINMTVTNFSRCLDETANKTLLLKGDTYEGMLFAIAYRQPLNSSTTENRTLNWSTTANETLNLSNAVNGTLNLPTTENGTMHVSSNSTNKTATPAEVTPTPTPNDILFGENKTEPQYTYLAYLGVGCGCSNRTLTLGAAHMEVELLEALVREARKHSYSYEVFPAGNTSRVVSEETPANGLVATNFTCLSYKDLCESFLIDKVFCQSNLNNKTMNETMNGTNTTSNTTTSNNTSPTTPTTIVIDTVIIVNVNVTKQVNTSIDATMSVFQREIDAFIASFRNPTTYFYGSNLGIGEIANVMLWSTCLLFCLMSVVLLWVTARQKKHNSLPFMLLTLSSTFTMIGYLIMAFGHGRTYDPQVIFGSQRNQTSGSLFFTGTMLYTPQVPPFFYARYLMWMTSTAPILQLLCIIAQSSQVSAFRVQGANFGMLLAGLIASALITETEVRLQWIFYSIGCACFVVLFCHLWMPVRSTAAKTSKAIDYDLLLLFTTIVWVLFPILWFLGPKGIKVISTDLEVIFFVFLDVAAKLGNVFLYLYLRRAARREAKKKVDGPVVSLHGLGALIQRTRSARDGGRGDVERPGSSGRSPLRFTHVSRIKSTSYKLGRVFSSQFRAHEGSKSYPNLSMFMGFSATEGADASQKSDCVAKRVGSAGASPYQSKKGTTPPKKSGPSYDRNESSLAYDSELLQTANEQTDVSDGSSSDSESEVRGPARVGSDILQLRRDESSVSRAASGGILRNVSDVTVQIDGLRAHQGRSDDSSAHKRGRSDDLSAHKTTGKKAGPDGGEKAIEGVVSEIDVPHNDRRRNSRPSLDFLRNLVGMGVNHKDVGAASAAAEAGMVSQSVLGPREEVRPHSTSPETSKSWFGRVSSSSGWFLGKLAPQETQEEQVARSYGVRADRRSDKDMGASLLEATQSYGHGNRAQQSMPVPPKMEVTDEVAVAQGSEVLVINPVAQGSEVMTRAPAAFTRKRLTKATQEGSSIMQAALNTTACSHSDAQEGRLAPPAFVRRKGTKL